LTTCTKQAHHFYRVALNTGNLKALTLTQFGCLLRVMEAVAIKFYQ